MTSDMEIIFDKICRLCVQTLPTTSSDKGKLIHIFQNNEECSLPIRIMACSALEVQESDSLPKQICLDCRKMLEKFYYFRTKCKNSDTKLRRHLRLINAGKSSNVFTMHPDEDEHEEDYVKSRELFKKWDQEESLAKEAENRRREKLIEEAKQEAIDHALEKERKRWELQGAKRMEELKRSLEEKFDQKNKQVKHKQLSEERKLNQMRKNLQVAAEAAAKDLQIVNEHLKAVKAMQNFGEEDNDDDDDDDDGVGNLNSVTVNLNHNQSNNIGHAGDSNSKIVKEVTSIKSKKDNHDANKIRITQVFSANENTKGDDEDEENIDVSISGYIPGDSSAACTIVATESIGSDDEDCNNIQISNKLFSLKSAKCQNTDEVTYELTETNSQNSGDDKMDTNATDNKFDESYEFSICDKQIKSDGGDYQVTEYLDEDYNMANCSDGGNAEGDEADDGDGSGEISGGNVGNSNDHREVRFEDTPVFISATVGSNPEEYENDNEEEVQYEDDKSTYKLDESTSSQNDFVFIEMNKYKNAAEPVSLSISGDENTEQGGGGKLYGCVKCNKTFLQLQQLKRHMAQHTTGPRRSQACEYCDRLFPSKSSLMRHVRTHTGEKPYKCAICDRSFIQKEVLKRHYMVHTGDRPFACEHCDRAFTQREMLRLHVNRVHTENPEIIIHACPKCSKTFQHASGLSRHVLIHTGKKFNCEHCLREFNDKSALKRHVIALHPSTIISD